MVKEIVLTVTEVGRLDYNVFLDVKTIEGMYEISPSLMEALSVIKFESHEISAAPAAARFVWIWLILFWFVNCYYQNQNFSFVPVEPRTGELHLRANFSFSFL
jgi:hypothetical protein